MSCAPAPGRGTELYLPCPWDVCAAHAGQGHGQLSPKGDVPQEQGAACIPGVRGPAVLQAV